MSNFWRPTASIATLRIRSGLLRNIREFFYRQQVFEVETPILSQAATVDVCIESFISKFSSVASEPLLYYLHTSPEFAMKRLLAAGSGDIYSLVKVFRNGEVGRLHSPEFTMLEYYRIGFDHHQLMDDLVQLLSSVSSFLQIERVSYRDLFRRYLDIDPWVVETEVLSQLISVKIDSQLQDLTRNTCLDLLFTHCIQPYLSKSESCLYGVFVYDYPPSMSALAKVVEKNGQMVAERFELFVNGVELANGYHELCDSIEQKKRFESELCERKKRDVTVYPYDFQLVDALQYGEMPECAGVALGVDRLLMLILQLNSIEKVMSFGFDRA